MGRRLRNTRTAIVAVLTGVSLVAGGCSNGGSIGSSSAPPSESPSRSDSPTDTGATSPRRQLQAGVRRALAGTVAGAEGLTIAGTPVYITVTWSSAGRVYDVTYPMSRGRPYQVEIRHLRGHRVLQTTTRTGESCWWLAATADADPSRVIAPDVLLLRSAEATSSRTGLLRGTVAIAPLLQMLGTDDYLGKQGLSDTAGRRTSATFTVRHDRVTVQVNMAKALRALGKTPKHGDWTWQMSYTTGSLLRTIPASRIVELQPTDPGWHEQLDACNARLK